MPADTSAQVYAAIGGSYVTTGRWYDSIDPATERVLARVVDCDAADADRAVAAAKAAAPSWAALDVEVRKRALGIAAARLADLRADLVELAITDTGARQAIAAATHVDAAIARLEQWSLMPAEALVADAPDGPGLRSSARRVPVGVVGCISPYNFPLLAMVGKAAPALFAGNTVVLKPAPQDPLLVAALTDALLAGLRAVGADPGVVNLITGAGAEAGAALVRNPDVAAVSFTGSTAVGLQISRDAAPTMKKLLLELGGKGACIVRADASAEQVVAAVARTWTVQSGQVCLTPARLIVDEALHDDVVSGLRDLLGTLVAGDPHDPEVTVGPVISAAQRDRVRALVDGAVEEGCTVVTGGPVPEVGYFVPPTLVLGCTPEHTIMQEEVFGPVLAVMRSSGDEQAVAAANGTRYGLYDYIFTADVARAHALAARLESAQVGVNTTQRNSAAPFGGNKASGFGRAGGRYSLDSCTTIQTITEVAADD